MHAQSLDETEGGSATSLMSSNGSLSRQGTPRWRSPESFGRKGQRPDRCSDVYGLAVTFCEVLMREIPFAEMRLVSESDVMDLVKIEGMRPDSKGCASAAALELFTLDTPVRVQSLVRSMWGDRAKPPSPN